MTAIERPEPVSRVDFAGSLGAFDGVDDLCRPRALVRGVDGAAERDDAVLGLHVDLDEVRRRIRGELRRDLGGDARVVDEVLQPVGEEFRLFHADGIEGWFYPIQPPH